MRFSIIRRLEKDTDVTTYDKYNTADNFSLEGAAKCRKRSVQHAYSLTQHHKQELTPLAFIQTAAYIGLVTRDGQISIGTFAGMDDLCSKR